MDLRPTEHAIAAEGLGRTFTTGGRRHRKQIVAVDGIDLTVEAGERLAFIGPNGAGKSTSIKILTGILRPTTGRATVLGLVPWDQRIELTRSIGSLFGQRSQLWVELTPRASFHMLAAIFGLDDADARRRVEELGELFEANDLFDQPVRTLSLGQRMRCELAACLLHHPSVLFLDEPTIGLDLTGKQVFRELLMTLNAERGTTIVLTSHDVADIEHVADRAVVVNHGRIIFDDAVASMRNRLLSTKRIVVGLAAPVDRSLLSVALGPAVSVEELTSSRAVLEVDTALMSIREALDVVLRRCSVADLSVTDPALETVIAGIYEARP